MSRNERSKNWSCVGRGGKKREKRKSPNTAINKMLAKKGKKLVFVFRSGRKKKKKLRGVAAHFGGKSVFPILRRDRSRLFFFLSLEGGERGNTIPL